MISASVIGKHTTFSGSSMEDQIILEIWLSYTPTVIGLYMAVETNGCRSL